MSLTERFQAYADAFEQSYADDDWSRIEPFFTDDAVYEGGPQEARGRDAVLAAFRDSVAAFDRRMDSRRLTIEAPGLAGNAVTVRWSATYTKAGCPDLTISGTETAEFEGERIARLRDDFDPGAQAAIGAWMAEHGARLDG